MPTMGEENGFISPVRGLEKFQEIMKKIYVEGGSKLYRWVKETFNMPLENALDADNLQYVVIRLQSGPEYETETVEATPERIVWRETKCAWLQRYKELEVDPEFIMCPSVDQLMNEEGFKAVNPKLTYKLNTAMPRGDHYCESIIELKEE